jgi:hypothetical protein
MNAVTKKVTHNMLVLSRRRTSTHGVCPKIIISSAVIAVMLFDILV